MHDTHFDQTGSDIMAKSPSGKFMMNNNSG
jgi:hypothetical protein